MNVDYNPKYDLSKDFNAVANTNDTTPTEDSRTKKESITVNLSPTAIAVVSPAKQENFVVTAVKAQATETWTPVRNKSRSKPRSPANDTSPYSFSTPESKSYENENAFSVFNTECNYDNEDATTEHKEKPSSSGKDNKVPPTILKGKKNPNKSDKKTMENKELIRDLIEKGDVDECSIDEILKFINSNTKASVARMTQTLDTEAKLKTSIAKDQIAEAFDETIIESIKILHGETEEAVNKVKKTIKQAQDYEQRIDTLLHSPNLPSTTKEAITLINDEKTSAIEQLQNYILKCSQLHQDINEMKSDLHKPIDELATKLHENSEKLYQFEQKVDTDYHQDIINNADSRIEEMEANIELIKQKLSIDNNEDDDSNTTGPPPLIARDADSSDDDSTITEIIRSPSNNNHIDEFTIQNINYLTDQMNTLKCQAQDAAQKLDYIQDGLIKSVTIDLDNVRAITMSLKQKSNDWTDVQSTSSKTAADLKNLSQCHSKLNAEFVDQIADVWQHHNNLEYELKETKTSVHLLQDDLQLFQVKMMNELQDIKKNNLLSERKSEEQFQQLNLQMEMYQKET